MVDLIKIALDGREARSEYEEGYEKAYKWIPDLVDHMSAMADEIEALRKVADSAMCLLISVDNPKACGECATCKALAAYRAKVGGEGK